MNYSYLVIDYVDPCNHTDVLSVEYKLRNYPVVPRWAKQVELAVEQYQIDDPERFYGFKSFIEESQIALNKINQNIEIINRYQPIINKTLSAIDDQDTLNYLHNVFERYHGLLNQQDTEFWHAAPKEVQQALADLNICVHRCESVYLGNRPRQVTTWYGLPKTEVLELSDYDYFTSVYRAGTVYINYVEIGKTFENLADDNDQYIGDEAFRPFKHFSADFTIKFYNTGEKEFATKSNRMLQYYLSKQKFFNDRGLTIDHPYMRSGFIPVADSTVTDISAHLYVKKVSFK